MNLQYTLTQSSQRLCGLGEGEEICYCVPLDIDISGDYQNDAYTVITNRRILTLEKGALSHDIPLEECEYAISRPQVSCGWFIVVRDGEEELIARFSAKHFVRYSYLSQGVQLLKENSNKRVVSREYETTCPVCGRALPRTKNCPRCAGRRVGIVPFFQETCRENRSMIAAIVGLMILSSFLTLISPAVQKVLVDDVLSVSHPSAAMVAGCLALMLLLGIGGVALNVLKNYQCSRLGSKISSAQRRKLFDKLQLLSLSFVEERSPGELMNRVSRDTMRIQVFMKDTFSNAFSIVVLFPCVSVYMFILNVKMAALAVLFVPIAVWLSYGFRNTLKHRYRREGRKSDEVNSNLHDVISGMEVVKSYGQEQKAADYFAQTTDELARIQRSNETFYAVFYPCLTFLLGMGTFLVTYIGGRSVLSGGMTRGELLQFISYASLLYSYVSWISNLPRKLMDLITCVERIGDIMEEEPAIADRETSGDFDISGQIRFKDVSFGYKSYQPVLKDVALMIRPGEMIGLVGASGTGKSTIINLIMHLYEADDGCLMIDGRDIRDIKLRKFHSQIGVVLQENFLFAGSILNNITFARPDASYEEVIRAAKIANAHDFISRLPDGYETYVGERGLNLSGGERQRIAIARAVLNDPKLLILDEATASLDTESEYLIQQALHRLTEGRTTIAIAHRLSTLKDANRLVVLDGQKIAETGTHDELLKSKGIYYRLVTAQQMMMNGGKK